LRADLTLQPGPPSRDGAPTWTLFDPAANRFLRLGWQDFEILSRWELGTPERIARAVSLETRFDVRPDDVREVAAFLEQADGLQAATSGATDRLHAALKRRRQHPLAWALKNYLFVRVPLVRPDAFLDATLPLVRPLLGRGWLLAMLAVASLGLFLAARQWEAFAGSFAHLTTPAGLVTAAGALLLSKIVHELAHAYLAKRYGLRVAHMGLALLVLWPVLYTDTTDAWRLTRRDQRLRIAAAGMAAELSLAALATLAWSLLPEGPLREAMFTLAAVTWILTLVINLNPFMRFDGYYLLSDAWDVPNLQERSFALGRWALRETLFAPGEPVPEAMPAGRRRKLVAFAFATWVYRFFLFLGIALIVYHVFFKVLGLILMIVEIGYFLVRPIVRELGHWWRLRREVGLNRRVLVTLGLLAVLVGLLAVPWQTRVSGPGLLRAAERGTLYAPRAARVAEVTRTAGADVGAGDVLIRLESPDLAYDIRKAERAVATLEDELTSFAGAAGLAARRFLVQQSLAEALVRLDGLRADRAELSLAAPFDGQVTDLADHLKRGLWVQADERLGEIGRALSGAIVAFVAEEDVGRFAVGARARFYPEAPDWAPVDARVTALDRSAVSALDQPELASVHGGALPVRRTDAGALVPTRAVYRVELRPETPTDRAFALRGTAQIWGSEESLAGRIWRRAVAVVVRESGF
jgi:putative peptide zinc metalloprotease protein